MVAQENYNLKEHHLVAIESAKSFIKDRFRDNISLNEISNYCNTSPFHFSRIFKQFTNYSPYQYLLHIRLSHAEILLRNTSQPITDICFSSGFNSLEHFATIFRSKFKKNPTEYRKFQLALGMNLMVSNPIGFQ